MTNQQDQSVDASVSDSVVEAPVEGALDNETPQTPRRKVGLLEALVSLSLIVSLAGITMPMIATEAAEGRTEQAVVDMQNIVDGIRQYSQDTLFLPTGNRGRTNVAWIYGPGDLPGNLNLGSIAESRPLDDVLLNDSMGGSGWQGPYGSPTADPWGNAYLVNVEGLVDPRQPAWVLSAGPDGIVQTPVDALKPVGDDVLLHVN